MGAFTLGEIGATKLGIFKVIGALETGAFEVKGAAEKGTLEVMGATEKGTLKVIGAIESGTVEKIGIDIGATTGTLDSIPVGAATSSSMFPELGSMPVGP
jgi:hypothetical protein